MHDSSAHISFNCCQWNHRVVLQGTNSKDVTEMGKAPTSSYVANLQQRKYGATCCVARGLTSRSRYASSLALQQFSRTPSIKYDRMVEIKSMATVGILFFHFLSVPFFLYFQSFSVRNSTADAHMWKLKGQLGLRRQFRSS